MLRASPLVLLVLTGCASTVLIKSDPAGAEVYVDGVYHGFAPVQYTDTAIVSTTHTVELRMSGYEPVYATFQRNANINPGALIGGLFLCIWPWLWIMDYPPMVVYRLRPDAGYGYPPPEPAYVPYAPAAPLPPPPQPPPPPADTEPPGGREPSGEPQPLD